MLHGFLPYFRWSRYPNLKFRELRTFPPIPPFLGRTSGTSTKIPPTPGRAAMPTRFDARIFSLLD